MSLPTSKQPPNSQSSIRSFFQSHKTPKYAPPPNQSNPESDGFSQGNVAPMRETLSSVGGNGITSMEAQIFNAPNIPQEAGIRMITQQDITALRRINALLLPVSYPDNVYSSAIDSAFSRVITWAQDGQEPKVVGGIICRVEPILLQNGSADSKDPLAHNIYIRSLSLLSPYRSMGLANAAIDSIAASALEDRTLHIRALTAHVWTENEEGLRWYQARGFQRQEPVLEGYYLKLRPNSAWLVTKPILAVVGASLSAPATNTSTSQIPPSVTAAVFNLPPSSTSTPPSLAQSYQNKRPDMEWNDLPDDMMAPAMLAPPRTGSDGGSGTSSRSSSAAARKRKDRAYPAAAFGN